MPCRAPLRAAPPLMATSESVSIRQIEVVPHSEELTAGALRLFADRSDKDWSLTDCLSFVVMRRRNLHQALTADHHFAQAGFRPVLSEAPPEA